MSDQTIQIKYVGTAQRWPEISITGRQSTWMPGQIESRSPSEASALLATGLFSSPPVPVTSVTSPGGGVELSAGGVTLGTPVVAVTSPGGGVELSAGGESIPWGTTFVYDENDRVVGIRDPHTETDVDLVTAVASPGGEIGITNIQSLTQAQYDALTPVATTLYVIVE